MAQLQHGQIAKSSGNPMLGALGTIAGTAVGGALGGPLGASIGGSLGGQLAGTGTVDPATTIASAAGSQLMGMAASGLQDAITPATKAVGILEDPLKATAATTVESVANVAPDAINMATPAAVAPSAMQTSLAGMVNPAPAANVTQMPGPLTNQAFSQVAPGATQFNSQVGQGGMGSFMKSIFG